MKPEVKEELLKWLRSGWYTRSCFFLRSYEGRMCLMGCLCQMYRNQTGKGGWIQCPAGHFYFVDGKGTSMDLSGMMEWAGIDNAEVAEMERVVAKGSDDIWDWSYQIEYLESLS